MRRYDDGTLGEKKKTSFQSPRGTALGETAVNHSMVEALKGAM